MNLVTPPCRRLSFMNFVTSALRLLRPDFLVGTRRRSFRGRPIATERAPLPGALSLGLLVEADHVSAGVAESRGNLRRVGADGLHDFSAIGGDRVKRLSHAVHHDVHE